VSGAASEVPTSASSTAAAALEASGCAAALCRRHSCQSGVTPILVVERLVVLELPFEIALVPEPDPIQILAPDGADQALERMRTWSTGNGLDLVDFQHPQVRPSAMKAGQRIVIRGEMPAHSLLGNRAIEHAADLNAVEIGGGQERAPEWLRLRGNSPARTPSGRIASCAQRLSGFAEITWARSRSQIQQANGRFERIVDDGAFSDQHVEWWHHNAATLLRV